MTDRQLINLAEQASRNAFVPYSHFAVGAALECRDGTVYTGCNVENASYGVGLCAECGLVSDLARTGGGRLIAFACVDGLEEPASPCGRCRQLLFEFGGKTLMVAMPEGIMSMAEVLPGGFGPDDLDRVWDAERNGTLEVEEEAE